MLVICNVIVNLQLVRHKIVYIMVSLDIYIEDTTL
jgi:hypothetical protein